MQAVGCLGMRACAPTTVRSGLPPRKDDLRAQLRGEEAADNLERFFDATAELMEVMAHACGHDTLTDFERIDLTTWKSDIADLTGIEYAGVGDHYE